MQLAIGKKDVAHSKRIVPPAPDRPRIQRQCRRKMPGPGLDTFRYAARPESAACGHAPCRPREGFAIKIKPPGHRQGIPLPAPMPDRTPPPKDMGGEDWPLPPLPCLPCLLSEPAVEVDLHP